jgi:hypothetical protein
MYQLPISASYALLESEKIRPASQVARRCSHSLQIVRNGASDGQDIITATTSSSFSRKVILLFAVAVA